MENRVAIYCLNNKTYWYSPQKDEEMKNKGQKPTVDYTDGTTFINENEMVTFLTTNKSPYKRNWINLMLKTLEHNKKLSIHNRCEIMSRLGKEYANIGDFENSLLYSNMVAHSSEENIQVLDAYLSMFKVADFCKRETNNIFTDFVRKFPMDKLTQTQHIDIIKELIPYLNRHYPKQKTILSFDHDQLKFFSTPRNFSFVTDTVAGSGKLSRENIQSVEKMGFTDVITLTEEPFNIQCVDHTQKLIYHHFPIIDLKATDLETMTKIIQTIKSSKKCLVHCLGGIGRTNMVLSCYLLTLAFEKHKNFTETPSSIIERLCKERVCKLTTCQVMLIKSYYSSLFAADGSKKLTGKFIMLIGPPCSGKTTLSLLFMKRYNNIIHINQDDLGKKECYEMMSHYSKKKDYTIILDRCNPTLDERKEWLSFTDAQKICIHLDINLDVCLERIRDRIEHPTLRGGENVSEQTKKIIMEQHKKIQPPTLSEGFSKIFHVRHDAEMREVHKYFGLSHLDQHPVDNSYFKESQKERPLYNADQMIKFPRTRHLINLGAATKDDLVCSENEKKDILKSRVCVEEKIDGANMGIFVDSNGEIKVHNRSHYVNSKYHEQFKPLDMWLYKHGDELIRLLQPKGWILYGEWMVLKHSIHYDHLPDIFIVFDIYDRAEMKFLSRSRVEEELKNTTLTLVPLIFEGVLMDEKTVKQLVHSKSHFVTKEMACLELEGVYIRRMDKENKFLLDRYKLVRPNFICGNNHWTKNMYVKNSVRS